MGKHTQGPWFVAATDTAFRVESVDGIRVVSTSWNDHVRGPFPTRAESEANARLAAAAPDMVDALRFIAAQENLTFAECTIAESIVGTARAALAKAGVE